MEKIVLKSDIEGSRIEIKGSKKRGGKKKWNQNQWLL